MVWIGLVQMEAVVRMVIFCKILVRHIEKVSRLIETSLLDMPNTSSGSTAQQMYEACNEPIRLLVQWEVLDIMLHLSMIMPVIRLFTL